MFDKIEILKSREKVKKALIEGYSKDHSHNNYRDRSSSSSKQQDEDSNVSSTKKNESLVNTFNKTIKENEHILIKKSESDHISSRSTFQKEQDKKDYSLVDKACYMENYIITHFNELVEKIYSSVENGLSDFPEREYYSYKLQEIGSFYLFLGIYHSFPNLILNKKQLILGFILQLKREFILSMKQCILSNFPHLKNRDKNETVNVETILQMLQNYDLRVELIKYIINKHNEYISRLIQDLHRIWINLSKFSEIFTMFFKENLKIELETRISIESIMRTIFTVEILFDYYVINILSNLKSIPNNNVALNSIINIFSNEISVLANNEDENEEEEENNENFYYRKDYKEIEDYIIAQQKNYYIDLKVNKINKKIKDIREDDLNFMNNENEWVDCLNLLLEEQEEEEIMKRKKKKKKKKKLDDHHDDDSDEQSKKKCNCDECVNCTTIKKINEANKFKYQDGNKMIASSIRNCTSNVNKDLTFEKISQIQIKPSRQKDEEDEKPVFTFKYGAYHPNNGKQTTLFQLNNKKVTNNKSKSKRTTSKQKQQIIQQDIKNKDIDELMEYITAEDNKKKKGKKKSYNIQKKKEDVEDDDQEDQEKELEYFKESLRVNTVKAHLVDKIEI